MFMVEFSSVGPEPCCVERVHGRGEAPYHFLSSCAFGISAYRLYIGVEILSCQLFIAKFPSHKCVEAK